MAYITARPFFGVEVQVVLRDGRFVHGRAKVRRIGQVLGIGIVGQKAQAVRIATSQVNVARVVPALRCVLQQVDGADRESLALDNGGRATRRQLGPGNKCQRLERTPGAQRAGSGKRVIDQVRSLQVKAAGAEISDFDRRVLPQTLLHRTIPLLNVLRRGVGIECRKAHRRGR